MHIDEILENRIIDVAKESSKIHKLLSEEELYFYSSPYRYTLFDVIDRFFRQMPVSGNYIAYDEFLSRNDFDIKDIEHYSLLIEKILTLLAQCTECKNSASIVNSNIFYEKVSQVSKVINFDLDKLGLHKENKKSNDYGTLVLVTRNDALASKAVEAAPDLAESIINYNRPSNKGNLQEKEKSLHFIIKEVEHIAQNKNFRYHEIANQAECIFNMFHLRHDNINGKMKNNVLSTMSNDELEDVFDMGFRLSLELLVLNEFEDIDQKVNQLRQKMKQ